MRRWIFFPALLVSGLFLHGQALRPDDSDPHYLAYNGRRVMLVGSGEHYGAVINKAFDYDTYLATLQRDGLNLVRIFTGTYFERQGAFNIEKNNLAPDSNQLILPWQRSHIKGFTGGGNKFDLSQWDDEYFMRLRDFAGKAEKAGIFVEVTLFSSFYINDNFKLNPFYHHNNINATDSVPLKSFQTCNNGNILHFQEQYTRKLVRELNPYSNVYFEIQNEPWFDLTDTAASLRSVPNPYPFINDKDTLPVIEYPTPQSLEWQQRIAEFIIDEERTLPSKHLIAQCYTNFYYPLDTVPGYVSIINFHYAFPSVVAANKQFKRPVIFDETGFCGTADSNYLKQAIEFFRAGGAGFNHLDYSFSVDKPDGTDSYRAPGGGSPALRKELAKLRENKW